MWYQLSKDAKYACFVFAVYNAKSPDQNEFLTEQKIVRRNYFVVRRTNEEMEQIFSSNGRREIVGSEEKVLLIKSYDKFEFIKFNEIKEYQFVKEEPKEKLENDQMYQTKQKSSSVSHGYKEMYLTFTKVLPDAHFKMDYVPFIYQERANNNFNKLIVFDIYNNSLGEYISINQTPKNENYIYEDEDGYNVFMLCRTSEPQMLSGKAYTNPIDIQSARFQVFVLYTEKIGRIQAEEFLISHKKTGVVTQVIGQKQLLFSKKIIQECDWTNIRKSQALPFYDNMGQIKGCQMILCTSQK